MKIHLPTEIAHYEPELRLFVDMMVWKLHINRHKGFAEGRSMFNLFQQLIGETEELRDSLIKENSQFAVALEAVDVSNQAFLLALGALRMDKKEFNNDTQKTKFSFGVVASGHAKQTRLT